MPQNFWKNKRVFLTGHTGFKGAWCALLLHQRGAEVFGYSLDDMPTPTLFDVLGLGQHIRTETGDIRDAAKLRQAIEAFQPDIVLHFAAQALVLESVAKPAETFDINVGGTIHVIQALSTLQKPVTALLVTSDKVYKNTAGLQFFTEDAELGGKDPYSASKACAEIAVASLRDTYFPVETYGSAHHTLLATVRAGNVIGGGDWGEHRLVPDIFRSVRACETLSIRRPEATRPWQHVLGALHGYLLLAEHLHGDARFTGGWNFGPERASIIPVGELVARFQAHVPELSVNITPATGSVESTHLGLDICKAKEKLGYTPRWNLEATIAHTAAWYQHYLKNPGDMYQFTCAQAEEYFK